MALGHAEAVNWTLGSTRQYLFQITFLSGKS